jgi:hypothetical protein
MDNVQNCGSCINIPSSQINTSYLYTGFRIINSKKMRWAGYITRMGKKRNAYRFLVGRPVGTRLLGRPRRRWVDNVKLDIFRVGMG